MEKDCRDLYDCIRRVYEDKAIRENRELSQLLLRASNDIIRIGNALLSAVHLDRQLDIYRMTHSFHLPKSILPLKEITQKARKDYINRDFLPTWLQVIFDD